MKARVVSFALAAGCAAMALSSCASGPTAGATTISDAPVSGANNLQVVVTIPPSWRPMLEDRVDDAFVSHVADIFEQEGYHGNLVEVRPSDQPRPNLPVLRVDLLDWRMGPTGNIDCTFGASLQSQGTVRQLGMFNGMAIRWMEGPGRFGLADSFGAAADDALRQLYRSISQTGLVRQ